MGGKVQRHAGRGKAGSVSFISIIFLPIFLPYFPHTPPRHPQSLFTNREPHILIPTSRYVNFAAGDEKPEAVYGSKERLDRLKALKAKWDPEGVFSNFQPIR